jgi:iron complex transport system substrate-binding protein
MEENYMDWIAGGNSMTANAEETSAGGLTQVNKEELMEWNPDCMIIDNHGGNVGGVREGILGDPALSNLNAVKNGKLYTVPIGVFLMNHCAEKPLYMLWLAKRVQPEIFADMDFNAEMKYFYEKFYHYQLSDEEIEQILGG